MATVPTVPDVNAPSVITSVFVLAVHVIAVFPDAPPNVAAAVT